MGPEGIARIEIRVTHQIKDEIEEKERSKNEPDNGSQKGGRLGDSPQVGNQFDDDSQSTEHQNNLAEDEDDELDLGNFEYKFDAVDLDEKDFDSDPEKE